MSAEDDLSDQENVLRVPAAKFIEDVKEYLAGVSRALAFYPIVDSCLRRVHQLPQLRIL